MTKPKVKVNVKVNNKRKRAKNKSKKVRKVNIPLAVSTRIPPPRFRRIRSKNNEQEIIVSGEDLIIPVPNTQEDIDQYSNIFINFPANPLYWSGTRLAGLARVYQQYRPLKLEIDYIPQVPVTVPGQVIMGTLWNIESKASSLQQNLMTSDGAQMIQCYQKAKSRVNLKSSKLPQRYFNVFGDMSSQNTNPFMWMATYTGTSDYSVKQPGYIYVHWTYKFCVAVGDRDIPVESISQTDEGLVRSRMTKGANLSFGWGIALSALRTMKTILRNTAVFFLRSVAVSVLENLESNDIVESTIIGVGRCYNLDVASIKSDHISITDDTGNHYRVDDESVRVCLYAHGEEIALEPEEYINASCEYIAGVTGTTTVSEIELGTKYKTNFFSEGSNVGYLNIVFSVAHPDNLLALHLVLTDMPAANLLLSFASSRTTKDTQISGTNISINFDDGYSVPAYFPLGEWLEHYPIAS